MTRTKLDTDAKLASLHDEMCIIKELLQGKRPRDDDMEVPVKLCSKKGCLNQVTGRFGNGLLKKQCMRCSQQSNMRKGSTPINASSRPLIESMDGI
jgi:hypothetical protein